MTAHYHDIADKINPLEGPHFARGTRINPLTATPSRRPGLYRSGAKRVLDIALVCLSAPLTLPLILVLALFVARDGGSPFYRQKRIGLGGRIYTMWKLRSMVVEADAKLEEYLACDDAARAEWDVTQKLKSDPRITRFGVFLRKSSIDELPQLWNVLKGDMSLVGPRPMMPEQEIMYPGRAYFALRPGITGFWQISDRNHTSFAARADYDAQYLQSLSLTTDLRVLASTVRVVLRCTGY